MRIDITGNIFFDAGYYLFYHILDKKSFKDKEFCKDEIRKVIEWMTDESKQ